MIYRILTLSQKNEWNKYLKKFPISQQDIYFTPEYYELYENKGDGEAQCFVFEKDGEISLYPFLKNSINKLGYDFDAEYYDIQGAYGYNGPISTTANRNFLDEFSLAFNDYCINENIIAEFIRFNPVLKNYVYANYITPLNVNDNVMIDLTLSEDDIWMKSFIKKRRGSIRVAIKNNITCKIFHGYEMSGEHLDIFLNIYYSTLNRNVADKYYYYQKDFYKNLINRLANNSLFIFAYKDNKPISIELVLFSKYIAYALFGGTLLEYYYFNPNSFLRFELLKYLKKLGISFYSMGGGNERGDKLYKFKKSFARNCESLFFIGKKIYNKKIYDKVCKEWKIKYPEKAEKFKNILLKYRF